jgi:integrase
MKGSYHFNGQARRFYVQVYWQGKRYQIWRYNGDPIWHEKTAIKLLNKIRSEIDDNTFIPKSYFPDSPLSTTLYALRWVQLIDVKPNTRKDYLYSIRKFISPFFKDRDIRSIRYSDLVEFDKSIKRCEKGKYNVMACLRTMLRWAYRNEDIAKVPPFPVLSQGDPPEVKYLTVAQQEKLLLNIPEADRPIFQFGMEYGLRIGEVRAIQWDCIADDEVVIKRAFAENTLMESTKTSRERRYGLTAKARQIIKNLSITSSSFVFVRADGKPYSNKNLNAIWTRACTAADVEKIKLYNAVRHSLGCQLLDQDVPMDAVQKILGHTRPEMTKRYAQRTSEAITRILENRTAKIIPMTGKQRVDEK